MNRIKALREAAGLTQAELAKLIGSSQQHVGRLEYGARKLTQDWLNRLAGALKTTPDVILGFDRPAPRRDELWSVGSDLLTEVANRLDAIEATLAEIRRAVVSVAEAGVLRAGARRFGRGARR